MATVEQTSAESRFLISGVSWEEYLRLLDWMGDRHIRVTYDGNSVEIMSPSFRHGRRGSLIGQLVERLAEELDLEICGGSDTTLKCELAKKGLEPDECYWFQNEPLIRENDEIDLAVDPPPDLAIEVEVSRSVLDKLAIYAEIGIPEIWRHRGGSLEVLLLGEGGAYHASETSRCLPMLPVGKLAGWVARSREVGNRVLIREYVTWIRETIVPAWRAANEDETGNRGVD